MKKIIYFSLILSVFSCQLDSPVGEEAEAVVEDTRPSPENTPSKPSIEGFSPMDGRKYIYYGSIGEYGPEVVVTLVFEGDEVKGSYYYTHRQKDLQLSGKLDRPSGKITLEESYKGEATGYFDAELDDGMMTGAWSKSKGAEEKSPLSLKQLDVKKSDVVLTGEGRFVNYEERFDSFIYTGDGEEEYEAVNSLKVAYITGKYFMFTYEIMGANGHSGALGGLAERKGDTYVFSDGEDCTVTFKFSDGKVDIEAEGCREYAGARAHFGGSMKKL